MRTFQQILYHLDNEQEIYKLLNYKDDLSKKWIDRSDSYGKNILMRMCENNDAENIKLVFSNLKSISNDKRLKLLAIKDKKDSINALSFVTLMYKKRIQTLVKTENKSDNDDDEKKDDDDINDVNEIEAFKSLLDFIHNDKKILAKLMDKHILMRIVNIYNWERHQKINVVLLGNLFVAINDKEFIKKTLSIDSKFSKSIRNESLKQLLVEYKIL